MRRIGSAGVRPDDVFDVLRRRQASGRRDDGHRLGLVVEGGTMRGVYTAGVLLGLHAMGTSALFDDVYGTSAGAVNGTHFVSGLGHLKADTYYRCLIDGRFFTPWRLNKVVDIDFLADEVWTRLRPVDVAHVMAAPARLWIAVADYATARPILYHAQGCGLPLLSVLKAAVAMPVLYNRLVPLGAVRGFDAGMYYPFPLQEAVGHGCTHLLVVTTRDLHHVSPPLPWWQWALFQLRFAHGNRAVMKMATDSHRVGNRLRDLAFGRQPPAPGGPAIATIYPVPPLVGPGCQDLTTLRSAVLDSARDTLALLGHPTAALDGWIAAGLV